MIFEEECSGPCDRHDPTGAGLCDACKLIDNARAKDVTKFMVFKQKPRVVEQGVLILGDDALALELEVQEMLILAFKEEEA